MGSTPHAAADPAATPCLTPPRRARSAPWLAAAAIVLAGLVAYQNSFHGPFILDDINAIPGNPTIRSLWPIWPVLQTKPNTTVHGRPVVSLSLALNYAIGGRDIRAWHAGNLLIHLLAALTLFGLVRRTLLALQHPAPPPSPPRPSLPAGRPPPPLPDPTLFALVVALLWVVHPLQTSAVTYLIQRAESLMALFYLLTLYGVARAAGAARANARAAAASWQVAAVIACLLGMGSKEVMVSAPLMALLYDALLLTGSLRQALRQRWRMYAGLAATWVLLAALVAVAGSRSGTAGFDAAVSWWHYLLTQAGAIVTYLRLVFWPQPLVLDYGTVPTRSLLEALPAGLIVLALLAAVGLALRRAPRAGVVGLWFFAILAPSSSFVPIATELVAEHRMYLALAPVLVLLVLAAWRGLAWVGARADRQATPGPTPARRALGRAAILLVVLLTGALTAVTRARNHDYRSALAICLDTVAKRPDNARAQANLGGRYEELARDDPARLADALERYNLALRLDPEFARAYYVRGEVHRRQQRFELAIADFDRAANLRPDVAAIYNSRGLCRARLDDVARALVDFGEALRRAPEMAPAWVNRGTMRLRLGQADGALADADRAIALAPRFPDAYRLRAAAYDRLGRTAQADADRRTLAELAPPTAAASASAPASGEPPDAD